MRLSRLVGLAAVAAALAACESAQTRIRKHQAAFDAYPPEVQKKIQEGRVEIGFTREQVAIALGRPDRVYTRRTATTAQEIWVYGLGGAGSRFGFGMAFGGPAFIGSSVEVGPDYRDDARLRVVFENASVVSLESRQ